MNSHKFNLLKKSYEYEPSAIIDMGSYKGQWTESMLEIYPDSKYYLFDAGNLDIDSNITNNSKIKIYNNTILYNKICEIDFYEEDEFGGSGNSIYKENTPYFEHIIPKKKKTNTINNIVKTDNILINEKNIFMKIDCQGAELNILEGTSLILEKTDFIVLEVPFFGIFNENASNFEEYIEYMESINFIIFDILEIHNIKEYMIQTDILFINKNCNFYNNFISKPLINSVLISRMERAHVINYVKEKKKKNSNYRVIDIGGSAEYTCWSHSIIDYIADINKSDNIPENSNIKYFHFDVNFESEWEELLNYVKINGKFDFCIASHIIEDISLPQVLLNNLKNISNEGFIAFPSKFAELSNIVGQNFIGYIHHKWIYTINDNKLLGFPKLNFIDGNQTLRKMEFNNDNIMDLSFFWRNDIPYKMIHNNYTSKEELLEHFDKLLNDDLGTDGKVFLKPVYPIDKIKYLEMEGNFFNIKMRIDSIVEDLKKISEKGYIPYCFSKSKSNIHKKQYSNIGLMDIDIIFINKNSSEIDNFKNILKEHNYIIEDSFN